METDAMGAAVRKKSETMEKMFREKYARIIHVHFDVEPDGPHVETNNIATIGFAFFEPSTQKVLACARFNLRPLPAHFPKVYHHVDEFWNAGTHISTPPTVDKIDPVEMVIEIARAKEVLENAGNQVVFIPATGLNNCDWEWLDYYVKRFYMCDRQILDKEQLDIRGYSKILYGMKHLPRIKYIRVIEKRYEINGWHFTSQSDPAMAVIAQSMLFNDLLRQSYGLSSSFIVQERPTIETLHPESDKPEISIRKVLNSCVELPPVSINKVYLE